MSKKKPKFYVVWKGKEPGVYDAWADCQDQIRGSEGAKFKSFPTKEEAEEAFAGDSSDYIGKNASKTKEGKLFENPELAVVDSICVDAACNGVGGKVEYKGVHTTMRTELFLVGPLEDGTNNIGEFLALVHGLAYLKQEKKSIPVYSDSMTAIAWVRKKKCNTKHPQSDKNTKMFELVSRAEKWLKENRYTNEILKWPTREWGEIPADFGRK
jgi:ribonuclease HI